MAVCGNLASKSSGALAVKESKVASAWASMHRSSLNWIQRPAGAAIGRRPAHSAIGAFAGRLENPGKSQASFSLH